MYGRERLWGAVAWALANILMGFAMDLTSSPLLVSTIFLIFGTAFIFIILQLVPDERNLSHQSLPQHDMNEPPMQSPITVQVPLWRLWITNKLIVAFFGVTLIMGSATSLVENLLFLFMRQDLNASYVICGISVVITVLFEIPLFFVGKSLLISVGTQNLFLIGMTCYIVRVIGYTLVDNAWAVLAFGKQASMLMNDGQN
jgi:hypothetical protein